VPLDANGEASLEIPLNDSLTSFRLVAVATGGPELFGTGSTSIRSTQDLMILSGITPLVREGDQFRAEFTLRNTTDQPMEVQVQGRVDGLSDPLTMRALSLASSQSQVIGWDIIAPTGVRVALRGGSHGVGGAADRIRVVQQVYPIVPIRPSLLSPSGSARSSNGSSPCRRPPRPRWRATPGAPVSCRGDGLDARLDAALSILMSGAADFAGGGTARSGQWQRIAAILPSHLDSDGLLKYFPAMEQGSEVLTPYALAIVHEAGWEIRLRSRAYDARLQRFVEGTIQRRPPSQPLICHLVSSRPSRRCHAIQR
jgi:hypothetical protein